jgi:hypothetical protein
MQCDGAAALQAIQDFMARWANGGMIGSAGDLRLFKLTCYRVLERAGDPRAAEWLERAHTELQSTAARVSDKRLRECFLANIPHHREIVAAWQQAQRQGGGGNAGVR